MIALLFNAVFCACLVFGCIVCGLCEEGYIVYAPTIHTDSCTRAQLPFFKEYRTFCAGYDSASHALEAAYKRKDAGPYLKVITRTFKQYDHRPPPPFQPPL